MEFFIGMFIGSVVATLFQCLRSAYGVLRIDKHNPEKDIYRLDVYDLEVVSKKKRIILKIDKTANLTQN